MQRKLIFLAHKTLVVSIPKEWAKAYGYKKGDTVELLNKKGQFLITKTTERKTRLVDLSNLPRRFVKRAVSAIYKTGITPCDVKAGSHRELVLSEAAAYFGLLVDDSKEVLRLKIIASPEEDDFDNAFRKVLLQLELLSLTVENDDSSEELQRELRKNVTFCLYLLSSKTTKSISEVSNFHYIISSIMTISYIYEHLRERELQERKKAKPLLTVLVSMIKHFRTFLTTDAAIRDIYHSRELFLDMQKKQSRSAAQAYAILIARIIRDCTEAAYTIKLLNT